MRLTPAQCAMHSLLGHRLPFDTPKEWSLADLVKHGREFLVQITHQDFGYDAKSWHDYLWDSDAGGYRWGRRSREKWARQVEIAMLDPEWRQAVKELNKIHVRQAIEAGLEDSEAERTMDVKDVRAEFGVSE